MSVTKLLLAALWLWMLCGSKPASAQLPARLSAAKLHRLCETGPKTDTVSPTLTAVVFLSPDCPLSRNYTLVLNRLDSIYHPHLLIVGVFAGNSYSETISRMYMTKYNLHFRIYADTGKTLAKDLHASITPEVFLLTRDGKVVYKGAIDNWAVAPGKQRVQTTQHYLQEAIDNYLAGKEINPTITRAVGCYIQD